MSIYRFTQNSPISSVTFDYVDGVPKVALIEASKSATPEQVAAATAALKEKTMSLLPVTVDDRDVLQVSGFLTEQYVIDALTAKQLVTGTPEITKETSDLPQPPKGAFKTFLENNSFKLAGAFNLIGDIAMHAGGYKEITAKIDQDTGKLLTSEQREFSRKAGIYDLVGGGLYTVGGLNSLAFGNSKSEAAPLADRTANFIAHVDNPQAVPLNTPDASASFLRRHTADVTLGAYTVGAGVLLKKGSWKYQAMTEKLRSASGDAAEKLKGNRREAGWLISYGISSLVFKLLSLFIKEKPKSDEDIQKSDNPIIRVKDWFVEKPLRIFGLGSLITDSCYAGHTIADWIKTKKPPIFKLITTASYFASDFLTAISSKNLMAKPLTADGEREVIARAAKSIAAQSPEKRDELVAKTVDFLNEQPELQNTSKKSIVASLNSQLKHMGSNPWAKWVETPEPTLQKQR